MRKSVAAHVREVILPRQFGRELKRFAIGFLMVLAISAPVTGQDSKQVTLVWSARSGSMGPVWVGEDAGLFKRYGINSRLVFIDSGSLAMTTLVAGSAEVVMVAGSPPVLAAAGGTDVVMFLSLFQGLPYQFYVDSSFKSVKDLQGKKIAVARFGSTSDFATRLALKNLGIDPSKDVTLVQVGSTSARGAALKAGTVYGTLASPPENLVLKKMGYKMIYDLITSKSPFQFTGATALRSQIAQNPNLFERLAKALSHSIYTFKTQKNFSEQVIAKYLRLDDREAVEEGYEYYSKNMPEIPYVTAAGFQTIIEDLGQQNPKVRSVNTEKIVDNRFVRKLEDEGFFRSLYAKK
jgi:NitT/TauT family transport system substrate-binding protein